MSVGRRDEGASVVLPMTAATPFLEYVNNVALRTLGASTRAEVLVLGNNAGPDWVRTERLGKLCALLGFRFKYVEGPFSQSRFWNLGASMTSRPYIVYANADCIFYADWLERLLALWAEEPEYWALWPWSLSLSDMGLAYRTTLDAPRRIVPTHHPAVALVMRRADGYRWDEQFGFWEMDADFVLDAQANARKLGLCLWSRVDHFNSTVSSNIDFGRHFGVSHNEHCGEAGRRLRAKWGLPEPKPAPAP